MAVAWTFCGMPPNPVPEQQRLSQASITASTRFDMFLLQSLAIPSTIFAAICSATDTTADPLVEFSLQNLINALELT